MAKRKSDGTGKFGRMEPNTQLDSTYKYPERERQGYVMGSADLEYGQVDGFREGITSTGHRFKQSPLGNIVQNNDLAKRYRI